MFFTLLKFFSGTPTPNLAGTGQAYSILYVPRTFFNTIHKGEETLLMQLQSTLQSAVMESYFYFQLSPLQDTVATSILPVQHFSVLLEYYMQHRQLFLYFLNIYFLLGCIITCQFICEANLMFKHQDIPGIDLSL